MNVTPPTPRYATLAIGNHAGGGLQPDGALENAYHATRIYPDGRVQRGHYLVRKWLANREAFDYDPALGWAYDRWFEWSEWSERNVTDER